MKFFFISILFFTTQLHAQYNFESCYELWKLTAKLRSGVLPTAAEWEALHQTAGYKRKNIAAKRWQEFIEKITLAFTPGKEEELSLRVKKDISFKPIIEYARQESHLKDYVKEIESMGIMDSAMFHVRKNLPVAYQNCFKPPVIYFVLYDYDGSATHQHIVMDLLISYHMDKFRAGIFPGHELYHYVLGNCRIKLKRFKRNPDEEHRGVFFAVNALSEEGTADLIDKEALIFDSHSPYLHRDTFYTFQRLQSPICIQKINGALEKLAGNEKGAVATVSFWMELIPWAAHIPGTFMSRVIRRNGLEKELIQSAGNSCKFFYLYNKAAAADPEKPPMFSPKAIRFLKRLEKKYIR